jgi:hypothetical protein
MNSTSSATLEESFPNSTLDFATAIKRMTPQQAAEQAAERAQRNMAERLAKMKRGEPVCER